MFSGFILDMAPYAFSEEDFRYYSKIGEAHLETGIKNCDKTLRRYITDDKISARKIMSDWFPEIDVDVFISHSKKDGGQAQALAGWLFENFKIRSFIDSNVWNHVDRLITLLKRAYGDLSEDQKKEECHFFAHAYMMLMVSLMKMIDKAESVILVNGGNALPFFDRTHSPWIFSEIVCTNLIRKKPLLAYRNYDSGRLCENYEKMQAVLEFLTVSYEVNLDHLTRLDPSMLDEWNDRYQRNKDLYDPYPLDALYEITKYKDKLYATRNFAEANSREAVMLNEKWNREASGDESLDRTVMILESAEIMGEARSYFKMCKKEGKCPCPWCENRIIEWGI